MRRPTLTRPRILGAGAIAVLAAMTLPGTFTSAGASATAVSFNMVPSSSQIAGCLPHARATVTVQTTTDSVGFDSFHISAEGLRPNQDYTTFLIQQAGSPFGAAEYIGDFHTNGEGEGANTFKLIVSEAFSSTLVNGTRVRKELNS